LLPINNLSSTPRVEGRLAEIVEASLRSRGVRHIEVYQPDQQLGFRSVFDDSAQQRVARQWAQDKRQNYAVSGSVHEWQYRADANKESSVGLTLKLFDVKTGQVLWQGNAARAGKGSTNLSAVASDLVDDLLGQITLVRAGR
jgi:TolB-like protein